MLAKLQLTTNSKHLQDKAALHAEPGPAQHTELVCLNPDGSTDLPAADVQAWASSSHANAGSSYTSKPAGDLSNIKSSVQVSYGIGHTTSE